MIPEGHPEFSTYISELELANFRFQGGEEFEGMFDGSKCFVIYLAGSWHSLWHGGMPPSEAEKVRFNAALSKLGLELPVVATSRWTGKSECFGGLRYYDDAGNEVEA